MFIANDDFRNDQLNEYLAGLEEAETNENEDNESENLRQRNNRTRSY